MTTERLSAVSVTSRISNGGSVHLIAVKSSRSARYGLVDNLRDCQQYRVTAKTFSRCVILFNWFKHLWQNYKGYENTACNSHDFIMGVTHGGEAATRGGPGFKPQRVHLNILYNQKQQL
jgi:hypothetical protein